MENSLHQRSIAAFDRLPDVAAIKVNILRYPQTLVEEPPRHRLGLCIVQPIKDNNEVPRRGASNPPANASCFCGAYNSVRYNLYKGSGEKPFSRTILWFLSHRNIESQQASSGKERHRGRIHSAYQYDADRTWQARGFQGEREELARVRTREWSPALGRGLRRRGKLASLQLPVIRHLGVYPDPLADV